MGDDTAIEQALAEHLAKNGGKIRNKAVLSALLKLIPEVGEALHHALTAGDAAIREERRDYLLDMLCERAEQIDAADSEIREPCVGLHCYDTGTASLKNSRLKECGIGVLNEGHTTVTDTTID